MSQVSHITHDMSQVSHITHHMSHMSHTGWRRLTGSPKLQIVFHKRATKYRSLLRKMTYKDKGSYESSPPCMTHHMSHMSHIMQMSEVSPAQEWTNRTVAVHERRDSLLFSIAR